MGEQVESIGVLDRISSLPDHILCRILSLHPIKDIVRTSIISLRWRFFSNPKQLSLECFRVNDYWVRRHDIPRDESYLRLNGWICAALFCGVKEIDIRFICIDVFTLPTLMFSCQSLVILKLGIGNMKVLSNACLPNLKTLHFGRSTLHEANVDIERATNLLKGIYNVQSLWLDIDDLSKTLFLTPLDPVLEFNNLVDLGIRNFENDDCQGTWIVEYLHRTPNVKTLTLYMV
ncbi:hypothetical protein F3Y22_tig00110371pilonHSYRG00022 [Hibiscus syriacus]|uniref:F-box domain-containing protein n=1 Tax=Hibiscus syriacus TaxID=106335 RepID=A0A6A3AUA8_HIBSY|nr:hypothetical protein F3Y22_tig00110371pilonHSYRG00022 [Hibiscus syriacus]